jgi:hypothetical protein
MWGEGSTDVVVVVAAAAVVVVAAAAVVVVVVEAATAGVVVVLLLLLPAEPRLGRLAAGNWVCVGSAAALWRFSAAGVPRISAL